MNNINFDIIEWAHDTPGKILSYQLTLRSGQAIYKINLDVPDLIELSLLIQDILESDKESAVRD